MIKKKGKFEVFSASGLDRGSAENKGLISSGQQDLPKGWKNIPYHLEHRFSSFLVLGPFNTLPHVVVTANRKSIFVATS